MRVPIIIALAVIFISFLVGIVAYPHVPESVASHWDAAGNANGTMPRFWGIFLFPAISLVLFIFLFYIPRLDPLQKNILKFQRYYDGLVLMFVLFMTYIFFLTLYWNVYGAFTMILFLTPGFCVLFYSIGVVTEHAYPNWTLGFRTPWTLSSPRVWTKTHQVGGRLFKIAAIASLLGIVWSRFAILFMVIPVLLAALATVIYSYVEFRKLKKK